MRGMDRAQLTSCIRERYAVEPEQLWARWPSYGVFRHADNRKWFAIAMRVPCEKLGISEPGEVDIVNVKADPADVPMLCRLQGILPAYHMSKEHWVSVLLDGSVSCGLVEDLVAASYGLTSRQR